MEHENWLEVAEEIINGRDCARLNLNCEELQRELAHVYWIGGSGCAGKSTIANKLAAEYGLAVYHCDDHFQEHLSRVESEQLPLPTMAGLIANRKTGRKILGEDQGDIGHAKYMAWCFAFWQEEFTLVVDDLRAMPSETTIVEGVPVVPWLASKIAPRARVVTMVGYDSFRRGTYMNPDRPEGVLKRFSESYDPARALENILQANVLIADTLFRCAQIHNCFTVEVDGSIGAESIERTVAGYFCL